MSTAPPAPTWTLQLQGPPVLLRPGVADSGAQRLLLARKDAAFLTWVALKGRLSSTRVAGSLWPDASPTGGLNNLRQRLHRLRRSTGARLLEMGESLSLARDLQPLADDEDALTQDTCAWDAELLSGLAYDDLPDFADWLANARQQRRLRRQAALERIAAAAEADGDLARALQFAQRLLLDEPLSEHAHRRLMRLHDLRGDTAAAVAAFEHLESCLKDQLGLRPGPETLALLRAVESADPRPTVRVLPVPALLMRPPRAVGREAVHRRLAQAHADGEVAVVVGEAGIGKSRLLNDFCAGLGQALLVQARPGDAAVPYGLLGRLVQALATAWAAALDGETLLAPGGGTVQQASGEALKAALSRVMARLPAMGCACVALDDLHFADAASLELLQELLLADDPPLPHWLLAHRPQQEAGEARAQLQAIEELDRVCWIELGPLSPADLHKLLADLALPVAAPDPQALAQALARHTGGNPLFVLETLRAMLLRGETADTSVAQALPRPEAIERLIDRRLRRLSPAALELVRVAAVAAPDFSPELAQFVLNRPVLSLADAWSELEEADLMRGSGFAHDLVHDAALRATPAAIAAHEHGRVAQYLEDRGAEAARIAPHWQAAAQWPAAAQAFERAAARAAAASRLREQACLLQDAVRCHLAADAAQAAARPAAAAVEALLASVGADAALALADTLLSRLPPEAAAWLLLARATAQVVAGQASLAVASAKQAQALIGEQDLPLQLAAARKLALALASAGEPQQALEMLEPWRGRRSAGLTAEDWMHFHGDLTHLLMGAGRFGEALPGAERHLELAREVGADAERMTGLMNLASMKILQGDAAAAILLATEADQALPQAQEQLRTFWGVNRVHLGAMHALMGNYGQALDLLQPACDPAQGPPAGSRLAITAQNFFARTLITLGQPARAQALLASDARKLPAAVQPSRLAAQAELARALGQDGASLLRQARALRGDAGPAHERLYLDLDLLRHADDDLARLTASAALHREAAERGFLGVVAAAAVERIGALTRLGRFDDVGRLLPQAEQDAWRWRRAYLPALLLLCTEAHAALGRDSDARRCLASALDWVHRVALPTVPLAWRDGFLHRNPHNRALTAAAARWEMGAGQNLLLSGTSLLPASR